MQPELQRSPPLSPQWAFVVQFQGDTELGKGRASGRVEHVVLWFVPVAALVSGSFARDY